MIYDILPVNSYRGNGNATKFDFDFYIENEQQLNVFHFDKYDSKTKLELGVDYTINEIKNKNGSYINFPITGSYYGVLSENEKISIELTLPISQETQYNNSSLLNLEALEYSLDYLTRLIQILARKLKLCLTVEPGEVTSSELINSMDKKLQATIKYTKDIDKIFNEFSSQYEKFLQYEEILEANIDKVSNLDNYMNSVDSSIDKLAKKFQLTNCVLEAPNGVLEWEACTITVKQDVKLLIPDGRNDDNSLKTIEKVIPNDISHAINKQDVVYHIFWFDDLNYATAWVGQYIISERTPAVAAKNSSIIWYDPKTNYYRKSQNESAYEIIYACYLGKIVKTAGKDISSINPVDPLNFLKRSDSTDISGWGLPSGQSIGLSLGASGMTFKAPKNGWLILAKNATGPSQYVQFNGQNSSLGYRNNLLVGDNSPSSNHLAYCFMPMLEGQNTQVFYDAAGSTTAFRFVFNEGTM